MKNVKIYSVLSFCLVVFIVLACNASTANLSSFKMTKDKEGKEETTSYKTGETMYGFAVVSNNPGKVKVKFSLVVEEAEGMKPGEVIKGSDVSVDMDGSGTATYTLPIPAGAPGGKYKMNADMINEAGEKKDSKSVSVTITGSATNEIK